MLNISDNSINKDVNREKYSGLVRVENYRSGHILLRLLSALSFLFLILLFIPWTQNIRAKGKVTTLMPSQRPQMIQSVIDGQVKEWFVREGAKVEEGDTILMISEIKDDYFDSDLLSRTQMQIDAKKSSAQAYGSKVNALNDQLKALARSRDAKLTQAQNKVEQSSLKVVTDSIELLAKTINLEVAEAQFARLEKLYKQGLKSKTDLESRTLKVQKTNADRLSAKNKFLTSKALLNSAELELEGIRAKYQDDVAKVNSSRFSTISDQYTAEGSIAKLENQLSNYEARQGFYYITAPQAGFVTQTIAAGIGETIKSGEDIVSIMPAQYDLAIEMFVKPLDLPLLTNGQKVRIEFDGWPTIVFSGWPNTSYGTFGGEVFAIDNFISDNGSYRILISPSPDEEPWPDLLRVGGGARGLVLLKDVPIWYEIWRNLNGFPPNFYETKAAVVADKK